MIVLLLFILFVFGYNWNGIGYSFNGISSCKLIFGDSIWLGDGDWLVLNEMFGGCLIVLVFLVVVCYNGFFNIYNEMRCGEVREGWDRFEIQ